MPTTCPKCGGALDYGHTYKHLTMCKCASKAKELEDEKENFQRELRCTD